jgi:hypothetical protein
MKFLTFPIALPILLLSPSTAAFNQTSAKDLKVTIRHTFGGGSSQHESASSTITEYYSGQNSRSEFQPSVGNIGGHRRALIRLRGTDKVQVYDLDLDAHEFVSYQTDLNGAVPTAKRVKAKPSGKVFVINTETVDTGERKEIFGQVARHLITKEKRMGGPENCYGEGSESEMDGWYIDYDALPAWMRRKGAAFATVATRRRGEEHCYDKVEIHHSGPATGYPLKVKTTTKQEIVQPDKTSRTYTGGSEMEVIEFSQEPLAPALFEVPPGFKKVDRLTDPTQRRMTYWEWLKEKLHEWFG